MQPLGDYPNYSRPNGPRQARPGPGPHTVPFFPRRFATAFPLADHAWTVCIRRDAAYAFCCASGTCLCAVTEYSRPSSTLRNDSRTRVPAEPETRWITSPTGIEDTGTPLISTSTSPRFTFSLTIAPFSSISSVTLITLCGAWFSIFMPMTPRGARGEPESIAAGEADVGVGDRAVGGTDRAACAPGAAGGGAERRLAAPPEERTPHVHSRIFRSASSNWWRRDSMRSLSFFTSTWLSALSFCWVSSH
mmetsp:Transcript_9813/g.24022  ORF Transcript_9813/g.24022 Transcript_9813/m.24022 type:complete len:248 (+) Transcript_9813:215-958(+)